MLAPSMSLSHFSSRQPSAIDIVPQNRFPGRSSSTAPPTATSNAYYAADSSAGVRPASASLSASALRALNASTKKRTQSEILAKIQPFEPSAQSDTVAGQLGLHSNARQSLRTLAQAPSSTQNLPNRPMSSHTILAHERGKSLDVGKLSPAQRDGASSPVPMNENLSPRPQSMLLARTNSMIRSSVAVSHKHTVQPTHTAHMARPDLERLGRSSTRELQTLSRLVESDSADKFAITSSTQEVTGLRGRRRLQRTDKPAGAKGTKASDYGWEGRNWMDKQRQFLQAYEYLCHIGEAKEWIEDVLHKSLPSIVELEEALRDGVTLAEVVEALAPQQKYRIFKHLKLQYRHSDNIAIFFRFLDDVELPELFRFELIDLYEKKNIPKCIYCIHALSWLLFRKGIVDFRIGNLVGQLEFEHHELEATQKGLDKLGANMPSFSNMSADLGIHEPDPEPQPEPRETEEKRIERELAETEETIVELQSQVRGALLRLRLGYTMQQFWENEDSLIDLQSRIRGDFTRQIMSYRLEMRRCATLVQSAARGFLCRRMLHKNQNLQRIHEPYVLALQSTIRANKVRRRTQELRLQLDACKGPVREIQAVSRGFLVRKLQLAQQRETVEESESVRDLQALVRSSLLRARFHRDLTTLDGQSTLITSLQAAAKGVLARNQVGQLKEQLRTYEGDWTTLQSAARSRNAKLRKQETIARLRRQTASIYQFQALCRAAAVRRQIEAQLASLAANEKGIMAVQSQARGFFERRRILLIQRQLERTEKQTISLQGRCRGYLSRISHQRLLTELISQDAKTAAFQVILKAMMLRATIDELVQDLLEEEEAIVALQSALRGFAVRQHFEEKKRYFNENMQKVVKIQSFVRAKVQGEAYKSLTSGKNPPVSAVKNFVHLLNDSDFDFNEEVGFERVRKTVVQQVRQNEMLEQYIDQLDIKIALLVKNKITLDEVVRHQHNYGGSSTGLLANSSMAATNQLDLRALNKSSRKKLESYQQLFFSLQTQPQYLARLFKRLREQGTTDMDCKRIELLIMSLFGYAQKRREEYYLLKLIARSIREEVEGATSLHEYQRGNFFWARLLSNYTRSPRDRKYLRSFLGPLIRDNIVEDPALDLESDPMQIYQSAINNEELRTGRPDHRPLDVPREVAIRDLETRRLFIDHLRDLREICDQFLSAFEAMLQRMPYGLRYLCCQMFESLFERFDREPRDHLLQHVCHWLWKFYLQPAVTAPEQMGVIERTLGPLQKRNLGEVARVVGQIASGRPFGGDNVYLQPLNAFVAEASDRMRDIMEDLISVADAESTFDIDEFNDLYAKNKPTLYIKMTEVFAIHRLVATELAAICPGRDDVLREITQDLGSAKNNEDEMHAAGSSDIHMFLTPKLHDVEDPDAMVKALFMETKRCVLYIIRVQTGANLLEILVKPITSEDESRWASLLREDFAGDGHTRGAYSDANMVDVTRMTYHELKRTALENVMRLEQIGRISKHNFYQDVLNAIASDIRTKSRRQVQRQRELEGVHLTLDNLHEKAKYLEQQRKSYDDYIEHAMATLQNKKGKKKFLLPFTKQYNHQRELERSGWVPKFGSYKYSMRALMEKGVVVGWQGVSEREWEKINLTISCDEVGVFAVEGSRGHIQIPGASALVPIEDLLQAQFEAHQFMHLFEGNLKLNVNLLLHLVYKKFYRTQ